MGSIEKENESNAIEAELCAMVRDNKFLLGMKPQAKKVLLRLADFNGWQLLKTEIEK